MLQWRSWCFTLPTLQMQATQTVLEESCYLLHFFSLPLLCCSKQFLPRSLKATVCLTLDAGICKFHCFPSQTIASDQQSVLKTITAKRMHECTCSGFKPSHQNLYRISYLTGKTCCTVLSCHYIRVKWGSFPDSADKFMLLWCKSNHSHLAQPSHSFTLIYSHLHHHFSTTSIITSRKTTFFLQRWWRGDFHLILHRLKQKLAPLLH